MQIVQLQGTRQGPERPLDFFQKSRETGIEMKWGWQEKREERIARLENDSYEKQEGRDGADGVFTRERDKERHMGSKEGKFVVVKNYQLTLSGKYFAMRPQ